MYKRVPSSSHFIYGLSVRTACIHKSLQVKFVRTHSQSMCGYIFYDTKGSKKKATALSSKVNMLFFSNIEMFWMFRVAHVPVNTFHHLSVPHYVVLSYCYILFKTMQLYLLWKELSLKALVIRCKNDSPIKFLGGDFKKYVAMAIIMLVPNECRILLD